MSNLAEFLARRYASMVRFHEFMQEPIGSDAMDLTSVDQAETYHFTGKVGFSHLSFGYDPERLILQDINLLIEPYQTVALVGKSGFYARLHNLQESGLLPS